MSSESYNQAFMEAFEIGEDQLDGLEYQGIEAWDSVGHMMLISILEEKFDIVFDMDDIIDLSSFEILAAFHRARYAVRGE